MPVSLFKFIRQESSTFLMGVILWVCIAGSFVFVQNFSNFLSLLSLPYLGLGNRLQLAFLTAFDTAYLDTASSVTLFIFGTLLMAVNFSLLVRYFKGNKSRLALSKNEVSGFFGVGLLFFSFGCGVCGGALLLAVSAFSTTLAAVVFNYNLLGYFGIVLVTMSLYSSIKLNITKNVCIPDEIQTKRVSKN